MENSNQNQKFNSLKDILIQGGIMPEENIQKDYQQINFEEDFDEEKINSFFHNETEIISQDFKEEIHQKENSNNEKRRLNKYDLELINSEYIKKYNKEKITNPILILKRFIDFKNNLALNHKVGFFEALLFKIFPKIYKAFLIKEAMNKMVSLNIDTNNLKDKNIPYGEEENHYDDLIKYINYANKVQFKLKSKI